MRYKVIVKTQLQGEFTEVVSAKTSALAIQDVCRRAIDRGVFMKHCIVDCEALKPIKKK